MADISRKPANQAAPCRAAAASGSAASGAGMSWWPGGGGHTGPREGRAPAHTAGASSMRGVSCNSFQPCTGPSEAEDCSQQTTGGSGHCLEREHALLQLLTHIDGVQNVEMPAGQWAGGLHPAQGRPPKGGPPPAHGPRPCRGHAHSAAGWGTAPAERPPSHYWEGQGALQAAGQAGTLQAAGLDSARKCSANRSICPAPRRPRVSISSSISSASCAAAGMKPCRDPPWPPGRASAICR